MPISKQIAKQLEGASWIRKMFEEGISLKQKFGAEGVCDYSLGNPVMEPPDQFRYELIKYANSPDAGKHRYMPNAGFPETRQAVADTLGPREGRAISAEDLVMTCGAGGALNVTLKALLNPGENVVILAPYFVEYLFYIANHGGRAKVAQTAPDFSIDLDSLDKAIGPKTRAVIVNSPNNPTGKVYTPCMMRAVGKLLRAKQKQFGSTIYLISDEPYRGLVFTGHKHAGTFPFYRNSLVVGSHSKDLSLAGERIGYAAVHPSAADRGALIGAITFCNRTLGFVNAPAIMQRVISRLQETSIDVKQYERQCTRLCDRLEAIGYTLERPGGAFYIFPQTPIPDDVAFVRQLAAEARILTVPGSGFGRAGHFRIAYCVDDKTIDRSFDGFEAVFKKVCSAQTA